MIPNAELGIITAMRTIRVGFDLDGVLIDKPPFIPRRVLQRLYKGSSKALRYRCPSQGLNRQLRIWSHAGWLRPPLTKNISYVHELAADPKTDVYLISSRYSFLAEATVKILRRYCLEGVFTGVFLNERDEPPHQFKKRVLKTMGIDRYFEDDEETVAFLNRELPGVEVCFVKRGFSCQESIAQK